MSREHLFKILVVGDIGTGKTSLIKRYVHNIYSSHYRATIGVDFALKVLQINPNTVVRLQLWDIAGQERFNNMTRVFYKEAVGAFVVFDVSRVATFEAVQKWKADIDSKVFLRDGSKIPVVLLANKCDLAKEGKVQNPAEMKSYCEAQGFTEWFETSASQNIGIEQATRSLVDTILETVVPINDSDDEDDGIVDPTIKKDTKEESGGCC
eukprot:m.353586 g.353586  ORF g.353586 m.353586 type:complete len:209 (+) comp16803_c0_seq1:105-731(+)